MIPYYVFQIVCFAIVVAIFFCCFSSLCYSLEFIHLNIKHTNDNDLEEINNKILNQPQYKKCNVIECIFIDRHCNINDGLNGDIDSHKNFVEPLTSFHI